MPKKKSEYKTFLLPQFEFVKQKKKTMENSWGKLNEKDKNRFLVQPVRLLYFWVEKKKTQNTVHKSSTIKHAILKSSNVCHTFLGLRI